ncbi:MAG: hypothetical protein WDW36_005065 [Sanguina aurantia]
MATAGEAHSQDPRWQRPQEQNGHVRSETRTTTASTSFSRHRPASRSDSFRSDAETSSLSIVFNAEWVQIGAPIGEGAFSRVFEGLYTNPDSGEQSVVAVKILKKSMLKRRSDCLRFIKEAKIQTRTLHRNIVACYGIGKYEDDDPHHPGSLFIVQELVHGGNMLHKVYKQMMNRQKCVYNSEEAMAWLLDVASGMEYLHMSHEAKPMIIHRDLKLENIMLAPDPVSGTVAKLVDFGLHKVIDDRIQKVVKRVVSEANLGLTRFRGMGGNMGLRQPVRVEEEEDERQLLRRQPPQPQPPAPAARLAPALARAPRFAPAQGAAAAAATHAAVAGLGSVSMGTTVTREGREDAVGDEPASPTHNDPSLSTTSSPACASSLRSPLSTDSEDHRSHGSSSTRAHAAPKKQSSMQMIMAKVKEIKLRVIGKLDDKPSKLAQAASAARERAADVTMVDPNDPKAVKLAQNEALLNRIIAQQSVANRPAHAQDDSGLSVPSDSSSQQSAMRSRPAPRRSVTWVNEIRYNLTEAVGSWAYMAPEVVLGQPYNEKVDVFSFGVIMFELLNRKLMLVDEIKNDPRKDAQAYAERVAGGFRPEIPRRWPEQLRELIAACWAQDPLQRPNFVAVLDHLSDLQEAGEMTKMDAYYNSHGCVFI